MDEARLRDIRAQLLNRRQRLESAIEGFGEAGPLVGLLREVDLALERVANGTYGLCRTCDEPIEDELVRMDPLIEFCLPHLHPDQQRALEQDLELASRIQAALLPENNVATAGWLAHYYYEPAGPVSGDYCDLVKLDGDDGGLFFAVGDVSGKGVAASMLMSHLHAVFHSLISPGLTVDRLVERASRLMCESTMSTHYATLVCGKAGRDGKVQVCNAGHLPPLVLHGSEVTSLEATGLPAGVFCNSPYALKEVRLRKGDRLVLYTDGLSEAWSGDVEYGEERVAALALRHANLSPQELVGAYVEDLNTYTPREAREDDVTIMVIDRTD